MKLWFGPYRGRDAHDLPHDYLRHLLTQPWISDRLRNHVENILAPDNSLCLGPPWWYRRRKNVAGTARDG
jgi:hypothetical protein